MQREIINPWTWQEGLGFVHANKVTEASTQLFVAGQTASNADGETQCPGDMKGQIAQTLANIATILEQADMSFSDVMRLNIYTTDLPALMSAHDYMTTCLKGYGCQHAGTLLGVSALAAPDAMVEMEVTALA